MYTLPTSPPYSEASHLPLSHCVLGPAWWRASKSVGGLSKQPGEAHLLNGEVDTCELRHAGVSPLFIGSKASNDINTSHSLIITKPTYKARAEN